MRSTGSRLGRVTVGCLGTVHVEHHFKITYSVMNFTPNVFVAFLGGQNKRDCCLEKESTVNWFCCSSSPY